MPNTGINSGLEPLSSYALKDIKKGEELFDDYGTYEHPKWLIKVCAEYGSAYDYFTIHPTKPKSISGFKIRYKVKASPGMGLGLFADQLVKKGALIWKYTRGENVRAFKGQKEVNAFLKTLETDQKRADWLVHQYHNQRWCNEIIDDGGYWNHSDTPNTGIGADPWSSYAIRDI